MADDASYSQESTTAERILKRRDFRFEHYIYPQRFFTSRPRPLRLIAANPGITTYKDVIYTPTTFRTRPADGCLYDEERRRIDTACVWRQTGDICTSNEPTTYRQDSKEPATYDRPLLYLGHISYHYGHFLLESLARWWAAAELGPQVDRYLVHLANPQGLDIPIVKACLEMAGIKREQILFSDKPLKCREVLVPNPSFQEKSHIYTTYRQMWTAWLAALDVPETDQTSQPLYISRRDVHRASSLYFDEDKIEAYLESKGARVIHPQNLSFAEQVRLFNKHTRIVGIAGSGMHNLLLSQTPKTMLYLTSPMVHQNNFLLDSCFDAGSTYLQSCLMSNYLRALSLRLRARAGLVSETMAMGIWRLHKIDYERVIKWFESSGYFA